MPSIRYNRPVQIAISARPRRRKCIFLCRIPVPIPLQPVKQKRQSLSNFFTSTSKTSDKFFCRRLSFFTNNLNSKLFSCNLQRTHHFVKSRNHRCCQNLKNCSHINNSMSDHNWERISIFVIFTTKNDC